MSVVPRFYCQLTTSPSCRPAHTAHHAGSLSSHAGHNEYIITLTTHIRAQPLDCRLSYFAALFHLRARRSAALVLPFFVSLYHDRLLNKIWLVDVCVRLGVWPSGAKYCPHLMPLSVGLSANALVYALFPYVVFIVSRWVDDKEGNLLPHDIFHPTLASQAAMTTSVQIATDHTWHQHMSLVLVWDGMRPRCMCVHVIVIVMSR